MEGEAVERLTGIDPRQGWPRPGPRFRYLTPARQRQVEEEVASAITSRQWRVSGTDDPAVWEAGWQAVSERIGGAAQVRPGDLRPQYFDKDKVFRLNGRFAEESSPGCEFEIDVALRAVVLSHYIPAVDSIVEFGCGTGLTLLAAAQVHPDKNLYGADWAGPVERILTALTASTGKPMRFFPYNMLRADGRLPDLDWSRAAVVTWHAMEQLGELWQPFLAQLEELRPAVCVHVEPMFELYGSDTMDQLARNYHLKRNYLKGFLPAIQERARLGRLKIAALRRVRFGNRYHEAYSHLAWVPGAA